MMVTMAPGFATRCTSPSTRKMLSTSSMMCTMRTWSKLESRNGRVFSQSQSTSAPPAELMSMPIEPGYFLRPQPTSRMRGGIALLDDLKGEFHQLAANDEAQVVLPELAEHFAVVHEKFETEGAPEAQQRNVIAF